MLPSILNGIRLRFLHKRSALSPLAMSVTIRSFDARAAGAKSGCHLLPDIKSLLLDETNTLGVEIPRFASLSLNARYVSIMIQSLLTVAPLFPGFSPRDCLALALLMQFTSSRRFVAIS